MAVFPLIKGRQSKMWIFTKGKPSVRQRLRYVSMSAATIELIEKSLMPKVISLSGAYRRHYGRKEEL
jgi:hypothetical protein